ncbi:MAG: ATP-binding protein [Emergencia sp.]
MMKNAVEKEIQEMYERIPFGVVVFNAYEKGKILFVNQRAARWIPAEGYLYQCVSPVDGKQLQVRAQRFLQAWKNRNEADEDVFVPEFQMHIQTAGGIRLTAVVRPAAGPGGRGEKTENVQEDLMEMYLYQEHSHSAVQTYIQDIADEAFHGIYIIEKDTCRLLYANESMRLFLNGKSFAHGKTCYEALQNRETICPFCTIQQELDDGQSCETKMPATGQILLSRTRETRWDGKPVYIRYVKDVTEETKNRVEKDRLEQYYQTLIRNLPGGIVVSVCRDGEIAPEFFSEGFAEMTGMETEEAFEFYKDGILSRAHPDERESLTAELRSHLADRDETWENIFRLQKKDGSYIHAKIRTSPISEGETTRLYGVISDITTHVEKEEKLKRKYNSMLCTHYQSSSGDAIMSGHFNLSQGLMLGFHDITDSGLQDLFGCRQDDFFFGFSSFITDAGTRETFREKFLMKPLTEAYWRREFRHEMECFVKLPRENQGRYVRVRISLVRSPENDDIIGFFSVSDVSERRIAEAMLLRMAAVTCDYICDLDLDRDQYRLLSMNEDASVLPGKSGSFQAYWQGLVRDCVVEKDRELCIAMFRPEYIRKRLADQVSYSFSYSITDDCGRILHKNVRVFYIDRRLSRVCLVRSDITEVMEKERKIKEELRSALALAREASQAKSSFLSSMSHDIRTPMNAIVGMTDMALADRNNQKQIDESLTVIKASADHLLRLINDILDMGRIESGRGIETEEPFNLRTEMNRLEYRNRAMSRKRGVEFLFRMDIQKTHCIGDIVKLEKILENLISNAFKFTPRGGTVELEICEVPERSRPHIGWYRFTVRDTGIGIREDEMEHIFEPFFRSSGAVEGNIEGTGLGLPIVKNLVESRGGTISVESREGQGTVFTVEMPVRLADPQPKIIAGRPPSISEDLSGMRILLAEDNRLNRLVATRILEYAGAEVVQSVNGLDCFEIFLREPEGAFDMILMDVQMPVMNGLDAAMSIRSCAHPDAETIPVIAMTANVFTSDINACLEAGMNGHVGKPVEVDSLLSAVCRCRKK